MKFSPTVITRRRLLAGTALIGSVAALMSPAVAFGSAVQGGILRIGLGDVRAGETLDPCGATNGSVLPLSQVIYETLLRRRPDFTLEPSLAESWSVSEDARVWTFNLRKGVKFHDGSDFTAEDVIYSLSRQLSADSNSPLRTRLLTSLDETSFAAADPHTLVLSMKRADALLPYALTPWYASVIRKGSLPSTDVETAIGTGPFKLVSFEPGQSWEVERFADYHSPEGIYLDGMRCVSIPDQSAKVEAVQAGAVHLIDGIMPIKASELAQNSEVRLIPQDSYVMWRLVHNTTVAPFDNPRVLKAMKLAIDREMILKTVLHGHGTITPDVPVPPSDMHYPKDYRAPVQDLAAAKALLAEAGYPDGFEYDLYSSTVFPGMADMAVTVSENLRQIGIKVNVRQWPAETYWDQVVRKQVAWVDFVGRRHAHDTLEMTFGKGGRFNSSLFDADGSVLAATTAAIAKTDLAERTAAYSEVLKRVAEESGEIIPAFGSQIFVAHKSVVGDVFAFHEPWNLTGLALNA